MTMSDIADRRRIRRKLTFWRVSAFILIALVIVSVWIGANGGALSDDRQSPHIARISISGLIQDDVELLERINKIAANDNAKALIVSISSPGGTTYGGEAIYKAIRKVGEKKPVISDVRTLAASAGYMIAIAGDHIVAGETSITGSIGVIYQYPQVKGLLDKLGVSLEEIKSAPLKAEPSPFHPASEEAKGAVQAMVLDSYDWFVSIVAERRKLDRPKALTLADGRVYTGRQALSAGLVDSLGGMEAIKSYLKERKVDPDLAILDWAAPRTSTPFLFGSVAKQVLDSLGLSWLASSSAIENLKEDKLLLDGLVSVWQVEGR
ncbi:MAG: hypothetical protein RLZZ444_4484 [Pseudomonadota bacterium]|jgi:protease-4